MFTTLFSLSLVVVLIRSVLADYDGFVIYTPNFVQCQTAQISWSGSSCSPYDILVVRADDVCGEAVEDLGYQYYTNSMNFIVNIPAGTQVVLSILDACQNEAWSGAITVAYSNDTSCLPSASSALLPSTPALSYSITPAASYPITPAASNSATTTSAPSTKTSTSSPSGTADGGLVSASTAHSTRPLSVIALLGSAVLAIVAFTL